LFEQRREHGPIEQRSNKCGADDDRERAAGIDGCQSGHGR